MFIMANKFEALRFTSLTFIITLCMTSSRCLQQTKTDSSFKSLPKISVDKDGYFTDSSGRVLLFHGLASVNKGFPWYSPLVLNDTILDKLYEWGFNVMRLGTMWSGVEPSKDQYNETYLNILETIVQKLESRGVYTFLDMHQDVMSQRFGTYDGFPSWLVDMLPPSNHQYPWPFPDSKFSNWAEQYLTEGCSVAFQGFYQNANGTLDKFADFWKKVASKFRQQTSILGYELINEPWAGNVLADPTLFLPGNAGRKNLLPAYDLVSKAIRSVDNDTIILFEPVTWGVVFNGKYVGSGFDHVPGGADYRNRSVLAYHMYCWILTNLDYPNPYPKWKQIVCDDIWGKQLFKSAVNDQKMLGCGGLLSEFGICEPDKSKNSTNTIECESVMNHADKYFQSWIYFDSLFFDHKTGNIDIDYAKPFVRTYPRATAGQPKYLSFDPNTAIFMYTYSLNTELNIDTEIFVPKLHHPNGFNVKLSDGVGWTYDKTTYVVKIKPTMQLKQGALVSVRISPLT